AERERERLGWLRQPVPMDEDDGGRAKKLLIELCVVLLAVTVYFVGWKRPAPPADSQLKPITGLDVTPTTDAPPPAAAHTGGSAGTAEPPKTPTIDIHPKGDCWVEVTSGGEKLVSRLMKDGDREQVPIRGDLRIRIGDPGAFAFSVDEVAGKSTGAAGQ